MPIQEDIAESAAADSGNGRNDDDPQKVQPPVTRRKHSAHRKNGNTRKVE